MLEVKYFSTRFKYLNKINKLKYSLNLTLIIISMYIILG